jgi:hypothetical protein
MGSISQNHLFSTAMAQVRDGDLSLMCLRGRFSRSDTLALRKNTSLFRIVEIDTSASTPSLIPRTYINPGQRGSVCGNDGVFFEASGIEHVRGTLRPAQRARGISEVALFRSSLICSPRRIA